MNIDRKPPEEACLEFFNLLNQEQKLALHKLLQYDLFSDRVFERHINADILVDLCNQFVKEIDDGKLPDS